MFFRACSNHAERDRGIQGSTGKKLDAEREKKLMTA